MEKNITPAGPSLPAIISQTEPPTRRGWLKGLAAVLGGLLLSRAAKARPASPQQVQGIQPYLGEIQLFAFGFTPRGWAACEGQLLPINQNQALFSILGTTFGGNGQTNFALPDLRGRTPRGTSSNYLLGQSGGTENVTISAGQLPAHSHGYQVSSLAATSNSPVGTVAAVASATNDLNGETVNLLAYAPGPNAAADATAVTTTGSSLPVSILAPYNTLNFCIALQGIFPSRS
ncbi:phage tail protein [Hymenobacter terricola]|uniref:phage tail protein n=1 Tax=Hymenobacter terricola TaxID=2819236 RepID=UPI001CF564D9|nr:tail fiber protein [Hymenobacter terricola]